MKPDNSFHYQDYVKLVNAELHAVHAQSAPLGGIAAAGLAGWFK